MLGAFTPFYRNHQSISTLDHEFYRFPLVAEAAKIAIKARYQLLDYLYTAVYQQSVDGTPTLNPMFFLCPEDTNTLAIQAQFFFGSSILVSPVTIENATEVTIYQPDDQFYDFFTYEPIRGLGDLDDFNRCELHSGPCVYQGWIHHSYPRRWRRHHESVAYPRLQPHRRTRSVGQCIRAAVSG